MNLIDPSQHYSGNMWVGRREIVNYFPCAAAGHWDNVVISHVIERFFHNTIRPPVTLQEEHGFPEEERGGPD